VYAFCVFLGVWTRSTIAAILLAVLIWLALSGIARADGFMRTWHRALDLTVAHAQDDIRGIDAQKPSSALFDFQSGLLRKRRDADVDKIAEAKSYLKWVPIVHGFSRTLHAITPKTVETNDLLDQFLMSDEEIAEAQSGERLPPPTFGANPREWQQAGHEQADSQRHASPWYVIGSSLGCEAVIVLLAAWIFCRRDY
jgi:hypothetical protein